jgi:ribosomal protein L28
LNCHPTNGTFGFAPTQSQSFRKTKRAVFPNALDYRNFYLDILNKCLLLPNKTTFET